MNTDTKPIVEPTQRQHTAADDGKPAPTPGAPESIQPARSLSSRERMPAAWELADQRTIWGRLGLRHMFSFGSFLWDALLFIVVVKWLFFS